MLDVSEGAVFNNNNLKRGALRKGICKWNCKNPTATTANGGDVDSLASRRKSARGKILVKRASTQGRAFGSAEAAVGSMGFSWEVKGTWARAG
ncbi:hypothetical protein RUM43_001051 [Polyplax serrata]|uniref:Uncharacterized protein n=1 Tax=Polyplax serrata TaxID=468196 RepID=A0AAN8SD82_POLSC